VAKKIESSTSSIGVAQVAFHQGKLLHRLRQPSCLYVDIQLEAKPLVCHQPPKKRLIWR
jgi:hypothetical protein